MRKMLFFILLLIFSFTQYAQVPDSVKVKRLQKIYHNLEYNTIAFNDLKNTWDITDPLFVREIFNRLVVANALKVNGKKPTAEFIKEKAKDIYEGKVFIELRRRYYDNEIELMRFFTESKLDSTRSTYFFDPLTDNIQIKHILGEKVYNELKKQFYAFNDLTKTYYDSKDAYEFDLNLQLTNPHVMFYSMTTNDRNKYLISAIGRWGNDYIMLPGWYYPNYVAGLKVTYIDYLINSRPHFTYSVEVGLGMTAHQPTFNYNVLDAVHLYNTGNSLYFKFDGNPLKLFLDKVDNYNFQLILSLAITQFPASSFDLDYVSKFYSTRNYFVFMFNYNNIFNVADLGWFNASASISGFDVYNYLYTPKYSQLIDLEPDASKFKFNLNLEASLSNASGLLHYKTGVLWNINFSDAYSYLGVKALLMLNNTFGFDFKFFTGFSFSGHLPYYRQSAYLIFSPIIRINY